METQDFYFLTKLIQDQSGIILTPEKTYLIETRLQSIIRKWGFLNIAVLVKELKLKKDPQLIYDVVECMTTNETFFFRDMKPFTILEETILPTLMNNRKKEQTIRIWSAACSSGQEAYSIAMLLEEHKETYATNKFEIIGTDISRNMVERAKEGVYSQFEVQRGLPIQMLVKYFNQNDEKWQIKDHLKQYVRFSEFNLLDPLSRLGQFDIVFCRNVLIYFNGETKTFILNNIYNSIVSDGYLFLGGTETVLGITNKFTPIPGQRGVYGPIPAAKTSTQATSHTHSSPLHAS